MLNANEKGVIIQEVMKTVGQDKTIQNLLGVLAENNRLGLVNGIIEKFDALMSAHRGEVEAVITSATVSGRAWGPCGSVSVTDAEIAGNIAIRQQDRKPIRVRNY